MKRFFAVNKSLIVESVVEASPSLLTSSQCNPTLCWRRQWFK